MHTNRRDFVRLGGLTALGLGLSQTLRLRAQGEEAQLPVRAKQCVLIWLDGGPSHLETFDMKPEAPKEVRGPLAAIKTNVTGVALSECFPRLATNMHRVALIRSMTSPLGEHNLGTHYVLSGYKPTPVVEYPTYAAVATAVRAGDQAMPPHVAVPNFRVGGGKFTGHGFLPPTLAPFAVGSDPAKTDFQVDDLDFYPGVNEARIDRRRKFVTQIDKFSQAVEKSATAPRDEHFEQAFQLITSPQAKQAFNLASEKPATRARYGGRTVGQSCLLARRLIERGVPFVTVNNPGWDTHENLYTRLKEGYTDARVPVGLIPSLDLGLSALLEDLADRGLLDTTLVLVMGEFGRTPKLNTAAGRDHWPRVFSVLVAGAGIQGGQVIGASDATGERPAGRPVTPADLAATIYTLLGIAPGTTLTTADGRPIEASRDGQVVKELLV